MKKIGLLFITGLFTLGLTAQNVDAGTYHLGATSDISFAMNSSSLEGSESSSTMNVAISGGYFPIDNMVAGLLLSYSSYSMGDVSSSSFGYGVYSRYYLMDGKLFTGASYMSQPNPNPILGADFWSSYLTLATGSTFEEKLATIGLNVGYVHWFNDNISLEPQLYYAMQKPVWEFTYDGETTTIEPDDYGIETIKFTEFGLKVSLGIYMN